VKGWRVPNVSVALNVTLAYIAVIVVNTVSVLREIPNDLDQTSKILLHLDAPNLFLAVPIDFGSDVIFSLHQRALDIIPRRILEREESEHVAIFKGALDFMILIEGVSRVTTELFMVGNKEDVVLVHLRCWGVRWSEDWAHNVGVRTVIVVLGHSAELIGLEEVGMELQSLVDD
jgi:hypothetical protein